MNWLMYILRNLKALIKRELERVKPRKDYSEEEMGMTD
jgi:hypothetical protein